MNPKSGWLTRQLKRLASIRTNLRSVRGLPEPYDRVKAGTQYRAQEIRALAWERHRRRQLRSTTTTTEETDGTTSSLLPADAA